MHTPYMIFLLALLEPLMFSAKPALVDKPKFMPPNFRLNFKTRLSSTMKAPRSPMALAWFGRRGVA